MIEKKLVPEDYTITRATWKPHLAETLIAAGIALICRHHDLDWQDFSERLSLVNRIAWNIRPDKQSNASPLQRAQWKIINNKR